MSNQFFKVLLFFSFISLSYADDESIKDKIIRERQQLFKFFTDQIETNFRDDIFDGFETPFFEEGYFDDQIQMYWTYKDELAIFHIEYQLDEFPVDIKIEDHKITLHGELVKVEEKSEKGSSYSSKSISSFTKVELIPESLDENSAKIEFDKKNKKVLVKFTKKKNRKNKSRLKSNDKKNDRVPLKPVKGDITI